MLTPAAIFDLDGTLFNCKHREYLVLKKPKNYAKFHDLMIYDKPNYEVLTILLALEGYTAILLATGRPISHKQQTLDSLAKYKIPYTKLYMKSIKDNRPSHEVKLGMLKQMRSDGYKPWIAFDDNDSNVKMFRDNGIRCCQVDYGNF